MKRGKISEVLYFRLWKNEREQTDRQTQREADRQIDRQEGEEGGTKREPEMSTLDPR